MSRTDKSTAAAAGTPSAKKKKRRKKKRSKRLQSNIQRLWEEAGRAQQQEHQLDVEEAELLSRQLFVSQLCTSTASPSSVHESFSSFGQVQQVQIKNKTIVAHGGRKLVVPNAVVEYRHPAAAAAALDARTTVFVGNGRNVRSWSMRKVLNVNSIGNLRDTAGQRYAMCVRPQ
eukprot:gene3306-3581_t